jgi:DNA-binding XRE family transcriptional regulator
MKIGNQGDGGGRPPVVLTDAQIIELQALAAVLNKTQVADYFGITEKTLREIEKRQPEVNTAYKKGKVKQIASMGSNLVQLAKSGNVSANIFYLKTQGGWKEEQQEPLEIPPLNIVLSNATDNSSD